MALVALVTIRSAAALPPPSVLPGRNGGHVHPVARPPFLSIRRDRVDLGKDNGQPLRVVALADIVTVQWVS